MRKFDRQSYRTFFYFLINRDDHQPGGESEESYLYSIILRLKMGSKLLILLEIWAVYSLMEQKGSSHLAKFPAVF